MNNKCRYLDWSLSVKLNLLCSKCDFIFITADKQGGTPPGPLAEELTVCPLSSAWVVSTTYLMFVLSFTDCAHFLVYCMSRGKDVWLQRGCAEPMPSLHPEAWYGNVPVSLPPRALWSGFAACWSHSWWLNPHLITVQPEGDSKN